MTEFTIRGFTRSARLGAWASNQYTRFWSKVSQSDGCWEWTSALNNRGYGVYGFLGRDFGAHRVSYELEVGPIAGGLYVCHRCDNPKCVRPDHLFLGSARDNVRDCIAKGRARRARGVALPITKATPDLVATAQKMRSEGHTLETIGTRLGVATATAWRWSGMRRHHGRVRSH